MHSATLQLLHKNFQSHMSINVRYSFIQLSELGRREVNENGKASKRQQRALIVYRSNHMKVAHHLRHHERRKFNNTKRVHSFVY